MLTAECHRGRFFDQTKFDPGRPSTSHLYGQQTITKPHACQNEPRWSTTMRESFRKPELRTKPTTRQALNSTQITFDETMRKNWREQVKMSISGFENNALLLDGTTWVPDRHLHTDQVRTEYRNRFNQPKPFHKMHLICNDGRLKKRH